jgi:DNA-directed RNA polymerase I subunit RPA49
VESSTSNVAEKHIRHYLAIFDPTSNELKVTVAKKMTVRNSVRQLDQAEEDEDEGTSSFPPQTPSSRAALTEAFGTKKSKKAVASVAENRLLARGGENADNPLSSAILSTINDEDELNDVANSIEAAASSRSNKPLPQADLSATEIRDVYPLSSLVFPGPPRTTLSQMPIAYWRDNIKSKKDVRSRSRFISNRVQYLTQAYLSNPTEESVLLNLQLLRYILLLIELHSYISRLPQRRPIPPPEKWPAKTTSDASLSTAFLGKLTAHFLPTGQPTTHAKTLLTTTILALTLYIPPPKFQRGSKILLTEPTDIALDLALQPTEVSKLFRELGCKMESVSDGDLRAWGLEKAVGKAGRKIVDADGKEITLPKPKFAKLKFPIEFPKVSAGRPGRR